MSGMQYGIGAGMGEAPDKLKIVMATAQNTLVLEEGVPVVVKAPSTGGGPAVKVWQILNLGPGIVFARWDGLGYAAPQNEHSVQLGAGVGYSGISAGTLTLASVGGTQVTLIGGNTLTESGFFNVGGPPPALPTPARPAERQPEAATSDPPRRK